MPKEITGHTGAFQPTCPNCGDLRPPDARLCPHCGAANSSGNAVVGAGILFVKILAAFGIGLLVLALGACGACTMLSGVLTLTNSPSLWSPLLLLLGAALLALAAGGIKLINLLLGPNKYSSTPEEYFLGGN